jgi:cytohesin
MAKMLLVIVQIVLVLNIYCGKKESSNKVVNIGEDRKMITFAMTIKHYMGRILILCLILLIIGHNDLKAKSLHVDLNKAFFNASINRDFSKMVNLLEEGADINYVDQNIKHSALSYASFSGDLEIVEFLIHHGANIKGSSKSPNYPIYFAILKNHINIVDALLNNGVNPNYAWEKGVGTLLTNAVQFGHFEIIKSLIERHADVNYCGNGDSSPLFLAVILGKVDIIQYLLDQGAKLNEEDKDALKKLRWFQNSGNEKILHLLRLKHAS